jgi:hypothetical protein
MCLTGWIYSLSSDLAIHYTFHFTVNTHGILW